MAAGSRPTISTAAAPAQTRYQIKYRAAHSARQVSGENFRTARRPPEPCPGAEGPSCPPSPPASNFLTILKLMDSNITNLNFHALPQPPRQLYNELFSANCAVFSRWPAPCVDPRVRPIQTATCPKKEVPDERRPCFEFLRARRYVLLPGRQKLDRTSSVPVLPQIHPIQPLHAFFGGFRRTLRLCQRPARRPGDRNPVESQNLNRRSRPPFPGHGGFPYQIEGRPYGHAGRRAFK